MPKQKISEEQEILQNLEIQAKKLALLLYYSTMSQKIKESWIALLPKMSLKQIDRLSSILEAKYLDEQTKNIDKKIKKKLETAGKGFQKQAAKRESEILKKINKLRTKDSK